MRLTDHQIKEINTLLESIVDGKKRLPAKDLLLELGWKEDGTKFKNALSYAFKKDLFPGFETVRGRYGGIKRITGNKPKDSVKLLKVDMKGADKEKVKKAVSAGIQAANKVEKPIPEKVNMENIIPIPNKKNENKLEWSEMVLGDKTFLHTMSLFQARNLMKYVFKTNEVEKGNVTVFGAQYQLSEPELQNLDNLIFYCFGAKQRISE